MKFVLMKRKYILTYKERLFLCLQNVIDCNIFPVLIDILGKAEFKTRKEAAWAIANATSGGSPEQIRYKNIFIFQ